MEGWISMSNKRLYRANQGAMLFGVCQGIANYFNIDATIVRLIWAILAISSVGFGFILYIACVFIIPPQATVNRQQKHQPKNSVFDSTEYTVKDETKNDHM